MDSPPPGGSRPALGARFALSNPNQPPPPPPGGVGGWFGEGQGCSQDFLSSFASQCPDRRWISIGPFPSQERGRCPRQGYKCRGRGPGSPPALPCPSSAVTFELWVSCFPPAVPPSPPDVAHGAAGPSRSGVPLWRGLSVGLPLQRAEPRAGKASVPLPSWLGQEGAAASPPCSPLCCGSSGGCPARLLVGR